MCVDYRRTNELTKKDKYPLPLLNDMKRRLGKAQIFTKLDLRDAFNLIRIKQGDEWKTAFRTKHGTYEYLVMPFGLTNAPATMQRVVNKTLQDCLDRFALVYMDDILVYSNNEGEHVRHVQEVLRRLEKAKLRVKKEKSEFHVKKVEFLGYNLEPGKVSMVREKVDKVDSWPEPKDAKDVQKFLGFAGFYQAMVPNFANLVAPLTDLLKKDVPFVWSTPQKKSFHSIKSVFASAGSLGIHDPGQALHIETDASDRAIGVTAFQGEKPIDYYSRKLTAAEANYTTSDKEMLAIVVALEHWRHYTQGAQHQTQVYTDHRALLPFLSNKELSPRQARWYEKLLDYDFAINHIKGTENERADALSRRADYKAQPKVRRPFLTANEKGKFEMAEVTEQNENVIKQNHDGPMCGHPGIGKTLKRVQKIKKWKGMKKDIEEYIKNCEVCAQTKRSRQPKEGLSEPLKAPEKPFQRMAIDFITGIPESSDPVTGQSYDMIATIVCTLTKYARFVPCRTTMTAEELAYLLMREVFAHHGIPECIISDRDKLFISKFNTGLRKALGMEEGMSTTFHPQTDGQTERMNQTLEVYLRCYTSDQKSQWVGYLPTAMMAINSAYNNDLGQTPQEALYGLGMRLPQPQAQANNAANTFAEKMHENWTKIGDRIDKARQKVKQRLDAKKKPVTVKPGDKAYLDTKNLTNDKLDRPFIGPFEVKSVRNTTVELALPETKIFPKFHASLVKKAPQGVPLCTSWAFSTGEEYEVERIIDERRQSNGQTEFLVKWKNYDVSDSTWEPRGNLDNARTALREFRRAT